ncbi:MAG: hypothetical protein KDK45_24000, partial [Leptospiraceae bacterium]|nr:hypothetical protein [Leptospiraceae bacterium]
MSKWNLIKFEFYLCISIIIFLMFPFSFLRAEVISINVRENSKLQIGEEFEFLEDKTGKMELETVQKLDTWQKSRSNFISTGFSTSYYWFRFSLHNPTKKKLRLVFDTGFSRQDRFEFYEIYKEGNIKKTVVGDLYVFSKRPIKNPNFCFPIEFEAGSSVQYYIRTHSIRNAFRLTPSIYGLEQFQEENTKKTLINGIIYGSLIIMFVYNLFLFITIKDYSYIYLAFVIIFYFFYLLCLHGISFQYFYPNNI